VHLCDLTLMLNRPDGASWYVHRGFRFKAFLRGDDGEVEQHDLVGTFRDRD
jgi:hypothetical protein